MRMNICDGAECDMGGRKLNDGWYGAVVAILFSCLLILYYSYTLMYRFADALRRRAAGSNIDLFFSSSSPKLSIWPMIQNDYSARYMERL